eukprot:TRINITY_DN6013_c0_g3_i2.p3 TRINITY_DN6013_c0_g3~~TRINITY_DN6013_c0_g3_i2.p3  ORF type:complete len:189 (-),score=-13.25 TRINITY_DN6013_c0_g3_i2:192-758(-)
MCLHIACIIGGFKQMYLDQRGDLFWFQKSLVLNLQFKPKHLNYDLVGNFRLDYTVFIVVSYQDILMEQNIPSLFVVLSTTYIYIYNAVYMQKYYIQLYNSIWTKPTYKQQWRLFNISTQFGPNQPINSSDDFQFQQQCQRKFGCLDFQFQIEYFLNSIIVRCWFYDELNFEFQCWKVSIECELQISFL